MRLFPAVLAALILAAGAAADDVVVPLTVWPGMLSLAPATALARSAQVGVTVVDARGNGAGWQLLARAAVSGGSRSVVQGVKSRCAPRSTCTLPRTTIRYPVVLSPLRPTLVYRAEARTGMGAIALTLKLAGPGLGSAALRFVVRPG